ITMGFYGAILVGRALGPDEDDGAAVAPINCFPAGTPILLADGSTKSIEHVCRFDLVMAFDAFGQLVPRRVVRLFQNVTDQWIELFFEANNRSSLIVTPGHRFLTADGG